jgi:hypothetical protein
MKHEPESDVEDSVDCDESVIFRVELSDMNELIGRWSVAFHEIIEGLLLTVSSFSSMIA